MKKNYLILLFLIASLSLFSQSTIKRDKVEATTQLKVNGTAVTSITTDTTLTGATDAQLPSALAVKTYVSNSKDSLSLSGDTLYVYGGNTAIDLSGLSGASTPNVYDISRLEYINNRIKAQGLAANESVTNYGYATVNDSKYKFSNTAYGTGGEYGGWLANGISGDSIQVSAPFGVIIGDSQAEGAPSLSGRLDGYIGSGFYPAWQDTTGQLSYHFRELTKMRWFNQGIGSQTSTQVLARFQRDALGAINDPSDGRGDQTLSGKPEIIVLIVGINDFYNGLNVSDLQANLTSMASLANQESIPLVMLNISGDEVNNATQNAQVDSINIWLAKGNLNTYNTIIVDYNSWWRDTNYDDNFHGNSLLIDDIHPTKIGYDSLSNYIYREAVLPRLDTIIIFNQLSPDGFTGFSRPNSIKINGNETVASSGEIDTIGIGEPLTSDSIYLSILGSTNITGTTYSGFSHIEYLLSNSYAGDVVTRRVNNVVPSSTTSISKWLQASSNLSPLLNEKVSIGTPTQYDANTVLTIKDNSSTNTNGVVITDASNVGKFAFRAGNGRLGINTVAPAYNLHIEGTAYFASAGQYSFFSGSAQQMYGSSPSINFQSTAASPMKQINLTHSGGNASFFFEPASAPVGRGQDTKYVFKNLAQDYVVNIDGVNGGLALFQDIANERIDTDGNILLRGEDDGSATGKLIMQEATNTAVNHISIQAQSVLTTNTEYKLPPSGTVGQKLTYGASDSLYWAASDFDNLYTSDGTLTGNRLVTLGSNNLEFSNTNYSIETTASKADLNYVSGGTTTRAGLDAGGSFDVSATDATNTNTHTQTVLGTTTTVTNGTETSVFTHSALGTETDGQFIRSGSVVGAVTANADNYSTAGLATASHIKFTLDADWNITGIDATDATEGTIISFQVAGFDLTLKHDVTSAAANRFSLVDGSDVTVHVGGGGSFRYDTTLSRWVLYALTSGQKSVIGGLYFSTPTETAITTVNVPVKCLGTTTLTSVNRVDDNSVSNRLRNISLGTKLFNVSASVSTTSASSNTEFIWYIAKNGTIESGSGIKRKQGTSSDVGAIGLHWLLELSENDYIELFVENATDNSNVTVQYGVMTMHQ